MLLEIEEINFPKLKGESKSYATLNEATVTLNDMGEKNIAATVNINGNIIPDFSFDWEVVFKGEKYIMPLRKPAASKDNTSLNSKITMTFQHWAMYQLKRYPFFEYTSTETGTAIPDKYEVPLKLTLDNFKDYFEKVLEYWYGDKISVDLNPNWEYSKESTLIEISYSKIWDVLLKLYEVYAVRWEIVAAKDNNNYIRGGERYVIRIGYDSKELTHIFKYGFDGGLMKVERQVQDEKIANVILGRGGENNIPYRYFKDKDDKNQSFSADPDWIPELKNIHFDTLRGRTFRDYIRGWKAKHYNGNMYPMEGAFESGYTAEKFDPIEYVKDDDSIAMYGEIWDALDNNEDIYPTIQGVISQDHPEFFTNRTNSDNIGRIDEVVAIQQIESDDVEESVACEVEIKDAGWVSASARLGANTRAEICVYSEGYFKIDADTTGNVSEGNKILKAVSATNFKNLDNEGGQYLQLEKTTITVVDENGEERAAVGIPYGTYKVKVVFNLYNPSKETIIGTVTCENMTVTQSEDSTQWKNTFNIWIKNIWATRIGYDENDIPIVNETNAQYAKRVWNPILGDGNDAAKIIFSSGLLSTSEDYEFIIVKTPEYDESMSIDGVQSHWKLTLAKCDADLESTGLYLPSTMRQGRAGDTFFFTGIDLPHAYVIWAENRLDAYKEDQLAKVCNIKPSWAVTLDKVRISEIQKGESVKLINDLREGSSVTLFDKRFIEGSHQEKLYIQQITYKYSASNNSSSLLPDVTITLGTEYVTAANPVSRLQGSVDAIASQLGSISNIEQIVRAVGDKLYLRKDGFPDKSMSVTEFYSLVTSDNFREGIVGGRGWGLFKDGNDNWVFETDRINVRQDFTVNHLVVNHVEGRGGIEVSCAATMEVTNVIERSNGYECYFDQRDGTVANLFRVNDVAWCNRFDPSYNTVKFYKRRVLDVGLNYILIAKPYNGNYITVNGMRKHDTGVNGTGIPEVGDVIIQYGNYTDKNRQYASVKDVIDGAYERFVESLDSVYTSGSEYYFIGRQNGMYGDRYRFFIGDANGYIKYENDKLSVKADIHAESTYSGLTLDEYVKNKAEEEAGKAKESIQSAIDELQKQIDGVVETYSFPYSPALNNYPAAEWDTKELKDAHIGDVFFNIQPYLDPDTGIVNNDSGKAWRWSQNDSDQSGYHWHQIADSDAVQALLLAQLSVMDTDILYIQTDSCTVPPTLPSLKTDGTISNSNGWSTNAPEWQKGSYIWQTTYVRRGSGDASFAPNPPVCISGKNGIDGVSFNPNLISGTRSGIGWNLGYRSAEIGFRLSNSSTTAEYLYSPCNIELKPNTEYTLSFWVMQSNPNYVSGFRFHIYNEDYFAAYAKQINLPTSSWVKRVIHFNSKDGSNEYKKPFLIRFDNDGTTSKLGSESIIYIRDPKIEEGNIESPEWAPSFLDLEGLGIEKIVEEYYLSDSPDVLVGGEWSETRPSWEAGKYYWTRSHIYYTDGTHFVTGEICVTADMQPGGVNIVLKSNQYFENTSYRINTYTLGEELQLDTYYVFTLWGILGSDRDSFKVYYGGTGQNRLVSLKQISTGKYQGVFKTPSSWGVSPADRLALELYQFTGSNTSASIVNKIKLERGNIATDWSPSPQDFDYLTSSLRESTEVKGGLVQTSTLILGYTLSDGTTYKIMAGSNGIYNSEEVGGGIAFWAGGSPIDLDTENLSPTDKSKAATYVTRMDGSGYMAKKFIEWNGDKFSVGKTTVLNNSGLHLYDSNHNDVLQITQSSINEAVEDTFFEYNKYPENNSNTYDITYKRSEGPVFNIDSSPYIVVSNYIANFKQILHRSFYRGAILNIGASIDIKVTVSLSNETYVNIPNFYGEIKTEWKGYVYIQFFRDGNLIENHQIEFTDNSVCFEKRINVEESGRYSMDVYICSPDTIPSTSETGTAKLNVSGQGSSTNKLIPRTIIGTDGFQTAWEYSGMRVSSEGVVARYKNYGIRLTNNGIEKMTDGMNWTSL